MTELAVVNRGADWRRLKPLVLDSVSCPITKRVYNLELDEFLPWYAQELRSGFTKATVAAWRVALEARGLGAVFHQRANHFIDHEFALPHLKRTGRSSAFWPA